jgi:serine/threonine protein kinase
MPFLVGETVGPYRITQQLGQGGMATVFKAYHAALDRYVALKAMHPAFMEDPNFLARFQREAQVVARLEHPNIVPIYDFAEHENRPYLVMKYIEGETLKARLMGGIPTEEEILTIVDAVSAALAHAHEEGILHRDIKPSNVLLANTRQIFLADFGLARIAEAGASTLSSDVMLGTPQYISPEQAMGKGGLDAGTDIYSFGVMLYEMVTGQVPFSADTPYSIIHDHIYTPLPLPRAINPDLSEGVQLVLLKALAKDPADRFEKVDDLASAYGRAIKGERVQLESMPSFEDQTQVSIGDDDLRDAEITAEDPFPTDGGSEEQQLAVGFSEVVGDIDPPIPADGSQSRRRWRWWYAVPLVMGLCLCGFIALGMVQDRGGIEDTIPPGPSVRTPALPVDQPPVDSPGLPPQIEAAQRLVDENPEDPFAHLELAAALYDVGELDAANETMRVAQDLAGGERPEFHLAAGDLLIEREQWFLAASMYMRFMQAVDEPPPPDVRDRMEAAIYLAAQDGRVEELLDNLGELDRGEQLLMDTVRGRINLYQERIPLAQVAVNNILRREPDYPPALLLQAEILLAQAEPVPAVEILEQLINTDGPPWVAFVAEALLVDI